MAQIKVNIQGSGISELTGADINALYENLSQYADESYMSGEVNADGAYEDDVNALRERFPDLHINAAKLYVKFKDSEVLRVLRDVGQIGDGVGITKEQLAAVTVIGTWFQNNSKIEEFPELSLTGVTRLEYGEFAYCENLMDVSFDKILYVGRKIFVSDSNHEYNLNITKFYFPLATLVSDFINSVYKSKVFLFEPSIKNTNITGDVCNVTLFDGGNNVSAIGATTTTDTIILRSNNAPSANNITERYVKNIFVKDPTKYSDVTAYANVLSKIFTIGGAEWQSEMRQLAEQYAAEYNPSFDIEHADYSRAYVDYDIFGCDKSKVPYVLFDDPEVENVLLANATHADENTITKEEMGNIKTIGAWFQNSAFNTTEDMFDINAEISVDAFSGSTIKRFMFGKNAIVGNWSERGATIELEYLEHVDNEIESHQPWRYYAPTGALILPYFERYTNTGQNPLGNRGNRDILDLGKNTVEIQRLYAWGHNIQYTIIRSASVPTGMGSATWLRGKITFVYPSAYQSFMDSGLYDTTVLKVIGGEEWQTAMRLMAEKYAPSHNPAFDIENMDYSNEWVDYEIFNLPIPNYE